MLDRRFFITSRMLKICHLCEKELGISQRAIHLKGWDITHSVCPRHFAYQLKLAGVSSEEIKKALIRSVDAHRKNGVQQSLDLFDPAHKAIVDWLKNPTESPAKTKSKL